MTPKATSSKCIRPTSRLAQTHGSSKMRFGSLGVGKMGQPMAGKLLDAGHELWIHDISEDAMRPLLGRQPRRARPPRDVPSPCDTVIVSLPTLEVFQRALSGSDGLLAGKALKT